MKSGRESESRLAGMVLVGLVLVGALVLGVALAPRTVIAGGSEGARDCDEEEFGACDDPTPTPDLDEENINVSL